MLKTRIAIGAVLASLLLFASVGTASAQPPRQEGLVNVYAEDVTVQIPIAIAANICGVAVNVLVSDLRQGPVECDADADSEATVSRDGNSQAPRQSGLVNVALVDITVQVPVSVAANVCGVAVNVLAQNVEQGSVDCEAIADADANA
jgi:hypothetical protein